MADTTWVDNVLTAANRVVAAWLNTVNNYIYRGSRPTYAATTGAANVYLLTLSSSLFTSAGLTAGDSFPFKAHQTNTGAATFSVAGSTTTTPAAFQIAGNALVGGEIIQNGVYVVTWTGTAWQLENMLVVPFAASLGGTGRVTLTSGSLLAGNGTGTVNFVTAAAKGDSIAATAAGAWGVLTAGTNQFIKVADSLATSGVTWQANAPRMFISGCTIANNAGDATNDIDFAAGVCRDSTNVASIVCAAMTKRLDANWAAGTNQGMRYSGAAIADTDYHLWAAAKADGTQDYYADPSAVAATVLTHLQAETGGASYLYLRLIGWIRRATGTIVAFHSYETEGGGIEINWDVPTLDINLANTLTTARRTDAVKAPTTFSTEVHLNVLLNDAGSGGQAWICCPDQADAAPSTTAAPLGNIGLSGGGIVIDNEALQMRIRTSAAGLIAARSNLATVDLYAAVTIGFKWARRNS